MALLRIFFVLLLAIRLFAEQNMWSLAPAPAAQPHYFVKIGAYLNPQHARERVLSSQFPTFILHMRDYYSVLSRPFTDLRIAKAKLRNVRKKYPDAYIVTLYKRPVSATAEAEAKRPANYRTSALKRGISAYNRGAYEEALAVFDRILIEDPENQTAELYYAKTLYQLHFYDEAREAFRKLQKGALSSERAAEIRGYLVQISNSVRHHHFSGWVALGTGYDNNINLTTDRNTTRYGPYMLINNTQKTKSHYATAEFALTDRYRADAFTLINRLYSYNELLHTAKGNDLNFLDLSTTLLKRHRKMSALLPVGGNILLMDGETISYNFYTSPTLLYQATANTELRTRLLLNDNHTEYASKRDYYLLGGGVGIRYKLARFTGDLSTAQQRYIAKEKGRYDVDRDMQRYRIYLEYRLSAALQVSLTGGYDAEHYRDLYPIMGYRRDDSKHYYLLSARQKITRKSDIGASWQYTHNHSNINTYAYIRQNYNIAWRYRF